MATNGNLNQQAGAGTFYTHALEAISSGRLDVLRPEILYPLTFPLGSFESDVQSGMEYVSKYVDDFSGQAKMRARDANDISMMGMTNEKLTVQVFEYAIGNTLDDKTIRQGKILAREGFSRDPMTYMPQIGNVAIKEAYEKMLIFGDTIQDLGGSHYSGFINNPVVDIGTGAGTWDTLDPEQIIAEIQSALIAMIENSNTVHFANTILLPSAQYNLIGTTKAGTRANDETILNYVKNHGLSVERNGAPLEILPYRYLKGAGAAGVDRMIAYQKTESNFFIVNPVDFRVSKVIETLNGMQYKYEGEISNLLIPYPRSMFYFDGI